MGMSVFEKKTIVKASHDISDMLSIPKSSPHSKRKIVKDHFSGRVGQAKLVFQFRFIFQSDVGSKVLSYGSMLFPNYKSSIKHCMVLYRFKTSRLWLL